MKFVVILHVLSFLLIFVYFVTCMGNMLVFLY